MGRFDNRKDIYNDLGVKINGQLTAEQVMHYADLDWLAEKKGIQTLDNIVIPGRYAIVRNTDNAILNDATVTDRYVIFQNYEAFDLLDTLIGDEFEWETAGSFKNGKIVYVQIRLKRKYTINGDEMTTYVVIRNTFDGSGALIMCVTPIRVICQNTLNIAIKTAKRKISIIHKKSAGQKIEEARYILGITNEYMGELKKDCEHLSMVKVSPLQVQKIIIPKLIPIDENAKPSIIENRMNDRAELWFRYKEAPDLQGLGHNGYRVINAVADYLDHRKRKDTENGKENFLLKRLDETSNAIDLARELVLQTA